MSRGKSGGCYSRQFAPPRITLEYPSDRAVIDVYEITVYPKTGKVEAVKARNVLWHFDVTTEVLTDPPVGFDLCPLCSVLTVDPTITDPRNSFEMMLWLRNNSIYTGRDVRAIFIENNTATETLEMLFPDGYTDIWAQNENPAWPHYDPDTGTNPFIAYYKDVEDRIFEQFEDEELSWRVVVDWKEGTTYDEVEALLIIDASWHPDPDNANCKEPYAIEFVPPADQYLVLEQGSDEVDFTIQVFDHQGNWGDLEAFLICEELGLIFPGVAQGEGLFNFHMEFEPGWVLGGTYEGVIEVTDTSISVLAPVRSLKEKMWVTVSRVPFIEIFPSDGDQARFISSPVRVQLDSDPSLETVYTADRSLCVIDEGFQYKVAVCGGMFVGIPTFCNQTHASHGWEIVIANDILGGMGENKVWVFSFNPGTPQPLECLWEYTLPSPPVGQPVPVWASPGGWNDILILCQDGWKVLLRGGLDPFPERLVYQVQSPDETYLGAPAIYDHDGIPLAAFLKHTGSGDKLEVFWIYDNGWPELYDEENVEDIDLNSQATPAIDDYPNSCWQIFVPSENEVACIRDTGQGFVSTIWEKSDEPANMFGQIALGDINHDNVTDVVVPFGSKMVAYDGIDGDVIWDFTIPGESYSFNSPTLVDFNGDNYLDVITGIYSTSVELPRLVVIDGSPFNNHNRLDAGNRILWELDPGANYKVMKQQPCITKAHGLIRVGMTFKENNYGTSGGFLYQAIMTRFNFSYTGESYNPRPWLKGFYDLRAWNNYGYPFLEYIEW